MNLHVIKYKGPTYKLFGDFNELYTPLKLVQWSDT